MGVKLGGCGMSREAAAAMTIDVSVVTRGLNITVTPFLKAKRFCELESLNY
jgi:hypothetical protein